MPVLDGFFALFKVPGISSAQELDMAKHALGIGKAGFLGTLDVPAAGVLPIAIGAATKLIPYLPAVEKEYVGEMILGLSTVTDDIVGEAIDRCGANNIGDVAVRSAIEAVAARNKQIPPHVSARRRDGIRGYDAVRKYGRYLEFSPASVAVHRIEILRSANDGDLQKVVLSMTVSPGFYVRAFCRDVGMELGCGACMGRLLRTRASGFVIHDALSLEALRRRIISENLSFVVSGMGLPGLLGSLPSLSLSVHQWKDFSHGIAIDCDLETDVNAVVIHPDGRVGGVANVRDGKAKPLRVLLS